MQMPEMAKDVFIVLLSPCGPIAVKLELHPAFVASGACHLRAELA
jgi:hypothetical protein